MKTRRVERALGRGFFERPAEVCARELVGCVLNWGRKQVRIVETEAYSEVGDPACHTVHRPSARHFVASHPAGSAYVYFNYGMHWMLNILTRADVAGFVLLRAGEPLRGIEAMMSSRGTRMIENLCSGPGKLASALGVTGRDHGRDLCGRRPTIFADGCVSGPVVAGPRVGISRGVELPWRFAVAGHAHMSRPRMGLPVVK